MGVHVSVMLGHELNCSELEMKAKIAETLNTAV